MATFDEMVQDVAKRLNLTSPEALQRIGERINERYKKVTSSIGLITSRRQTRDFEIDPVTPANSTSGVDATDLPNLTIFGFEKILRITRTDDDTGGVTILKKVTFDRVENINQQTDRLPHAWADKRMGSGFVVITLDSYTAGDPFTLHVEGYDITDVLADDAEPVLPTDFHDILIEGAMADELMKMEKLQLSTIREQKFESRLSDLRMFIAVNGYQDIYQGKDRPNQLWYQHWLSRITIFE